MKHLKKFESFSINEELLGLPKMIEVKGKVKSWLDSNKNNPELQKKIEELRAQFKKLDPKSQQKLRTLASETPEEVKAQVEPELKDEVSAVTESHIINEKIDWKNFASKFFKILGISTAASGFIETMWAVITMTTTGSGYSELFGSTAGQVASNGMLTILSAIVPIVISLILEPDQEKK